MTRHKNISSDTQNTIDLEVRTLIDRNYQRAKQLLTDNLPKLKVMAEALMKYETIDSDQIDAIMKGQQPGAPKGWDDSDHGGQPEAAPAAAPASKTDTKIGGPASQH